MSDLESVVEETLASQLGDAAPGATVAIVNSDEIALAKGYGHADVETGRRIDKKATATRIGSVSKLVTWTAVMQGVQDGVLELDADVNSYLEDSPVTIPDTYANPVTLRHLGTHTAGFSVVPNPGLVTNSEALPRLETALVEDQPDRIRPPDEAVAYSNWGATLAGHIVAEAYDTTFEEYVQSNIFDPLGMKHSTFDQPVPADHPGNLAAPHDSSGDGITRADPVYINWRPAGSMSATALDMAAFMQAHLGYGTDAILNSETMATMHSRQYGRHPAVNGLRYGFFEYGSPSTSYIGHSGGTVYYTAWLGLLPDHDVGVFIGFNGPGDPITPAAEILAEYDLFAESLTPDPTTGRASRERAEAVVGEYKSTGSSFENDWRQVLGLLSRLSVDATDDGGLVTQTMGGDAVEWVETEPYVYHERNGDDVLAVDVVDGRVRQLYLNSQPSTAFLPVTTPNQRAVTLGAVGAAVGGSALSLAGWAGASGWRRLNRSGSGGDSKSTATDETTQPDSGEEGSQ
ncbi:beta-lactamase [Halorubrum californiense DSM 19288]|uniref:Beta-lactamase n=1 Tax=Halorubrum californiense DSM 19288 TaxID=1227465 RepID=M0EMS2_9EURY|nr:serine hydrolase domain-containing protein [Halorubrum californiense]ELZ49056.1 beta-lactamase [Halorubrum californiense DSM 19288]